MPANTPQKVALRQKLKRKYNENFRLRKKVNEMKKVGFHTGYKTRRKVKERKGSLRKNTKLLLDLCDKNVSFIAREIITNVINNKNSYSNDFKSFCVSLYNSGPKAYRFLRKDLKFPCVQTLKTYLQERIVTNPGVSESILKQLSVIVNTFSDRNKFCTLLLDEISLKSHLDLSTKFDSIIGLEDFGNDRRSPNLATHALCAMVRGIAKDYRQLLGFIFINKATKVKVLDNFVSETLHGVQDIGLNVIAITTDQGSNFQSYFRQKGVTPNNPIMEWNGKKIVIIPDPPHLLKSTRNCIKENIIQTPEGIVDWEHIVKTFHLCRARNFSYIPHVSYNFIFLPAFGGKMKVKAAAKVLSNSMSVAIETLCEQKYLGKESLVTASFCQNFNKLFDVINSSPNQCHRTPFHKPLSINDSNWLFLNEMICWISSFKVFKDKTMVKEKTANFKFLSG
jgi:hypothetical protein